MEIRPVPRSLLALTLLSALLPSAAAPTTSCEQGARDAAHRFAQALKNSDASLLRPILPSRGRVQLRLEVLGPENGFFSGSQVEALLGGFLKRGSVHSIDLLRLESDADCYTLVHARAVLTDRQGRPGRIGLQLAFQPEDKGWVIREIRETSQ